MATRIRLRRVGRKKLPMYRIVVADKRAPRDGRFIEILGTYAPTAKTKKVTVDADRARAWLAQGATTSETVESLFRKAGVYQTAEAAGVAEAGGGAETAEAAEAAPSE